MQSKTIKLGNELANEIYATLESLNMKRSLGIIQVGDLAASNKYINIKKKRLEMLKWKVRHDKLHELTDEDEFRSHVIDMGADPEIDGIIIQMPLPAKYQSNFIDLIPYYKDVDGLTTINQGKLFRSISNDSQILDDCLMPCTARACLHMLEANHINLRGTHVAILGRSSLVGRPISILLQNKGATVVHLNQADKNQESLCKACDVVISAIGIPNYVTQDYVKPGAFVIDIGLSEINGTLVGDVHEEVQQIAFVTPSRGGIGPLTVAFLMDNLAKSRFYARHD